MFRSASVVVVFATVLLASGAAMAACPVTYTFTNGVTADAGQVNQNFTDLTSCLAPAANPSFSGTLAAAASSFSGDMVVGGTTGSPTGRVAIGATINSSVLVNGRHDTNGNVYGLNVVNANGGAAATALIQAGNGTHGLTVTMLGSGFTTSGILRQDGALLLSDGAGGVTIGTSVSQPLFFAVNMAEVGRVGSDGSLLWGTQTNGGWSTNATVALQKSGGTVLSVYETGAGFYNARTTRVDNASARFDTFNYNGSEVGSISTTGSATAYNTSSDARLKSHIVQLPADKALRALRAYRPQEYLIRGEPGVGALAQDVDRRMSVVGIDAARLGLVTRGDRNAALKEGQAGFRQWSMDSAKMVPFVIATALDHEERLKTLEADNAALRRQVRDLMATVSALANANGQRTDKRADSARARALR